MTKHPKTEEHSSHKLETTPLVQLDLSDNHLSGSIPQHLSSSKLELLFLHNNQLTSWFPLELYTDLVHGGQLSVSGNEGLCSVESSILPKCSLWTMALHSKLVTVLIVIMIWAIVRQLTQQRYEYDANNPNLVFNGTFRMGVAVCIAFFHFLRIILLYAIAGVSVNDTYAIMRFKVLLQILSFFSCVSFIVGALRHNWGQIRSCHMVVISGCLLFSLHLSAAAFLVIYSRPWLSTLERFWCILNVCVYFCLYDMRESFDLRAYLVLKIINPLRQALKRIGWMHYAMLAFAIWLTLSTWLTS